MSTDRFRFVQLDVPGRLGLDDGRYLLRALDGGEDGETVLVVQTTGAPPAGRRPRRRRRPRRAEPEADPSPVPITRLTVIPSRAGDPDEAKRELAGVAEDAQVAEAAIAEGLRAANHLLRSHRVATQDPYGHEISREGPLVVRIGFGTGQDLADGNWEEAVEIAPPERRRRRIDSLRPQERLAELLAGREGIDVCETLLLRARADVDQGRPREAALQLEPGLEALLAELAEGAGADQKDDLTALRDRREATGRARRDALRGDLSDEQADGIADTLRICERVLRRRQALRD